MLDKEVFKSHFAVLCEIYKTPGTITLIDIYYRNLKNMTDEEFKSGVENIINDRSKDKFPKPGEIRDYGGGGSSARAIAAKDKLMKALRNQGAYATVVFDDPVLHKMIDMQGGWIKINKMEDKDIDKWLKYDFERIYEAFSKMKFGNIPLVFHGIYDNQNKIEDMSNAVYIGDREKALNWTDAFRAKVLENKVTKAIEDRRGIDGNT